MKKLKRQIIDALNNENGGPNIENIIGIGISLMCVYGLQKVQASVYSWVVNFADFISKI